MMNVQNNKKHKNFSFLLYFSAYGVSQKLYKNKYCVFYYFEYLKIENCNIMLDYKNKTKVTFRI